MRSAGGSYTGGAGRTQWRRWKTAKKNRISGLWAAAPAGGVVCGAVSGAVWGRGPGRAGGLKIAPRPLQAVGESAISPASGVARPCLHVQ